jgi:hypothetical protein
MKNTTEKLNALYAELDHRAQRRADGHDTLSGEAKDPVIDLPETDARPS